MRDVTRVVLAPDKFKGSLSAVNVCAALSLGLGDLGDAVSAASLPVADGGDGTVDAALTAGFRRVPMTVSGPTGARHDTYFAIRDDLAILELATVCGLQRLPDGILRPMTSTTRGFGEAILYALGMGARTIVLGVGGSASTDGGAGMLQALGLRALDAHGTAVRDGAVGLGDVRMISVAELAPELREARFVLASDVDNPLIGPDGAAIRYGPQKGASAQEIVRMEDALEAWGEAVAGTVGFDARYMHGAGAAGGVGFAALSVLQAEARPGIELMLDLLGFDEVVRGADLVITGEGSLDAQSLHGKAPVGVARAAARAGVATIAVCGRLEASLAELNDAGIRRAYSLMELEPDEERCMRNAASLLRELCSTRLRADVVRSA
ncbi:Glycerate kinase [Nocardioides sp. PD653]|nr:Glycerate kinase [Nocardioides sp. PD653-B2]GAW53803.1 Glycerate kinase [Nocardioides sp. PD653]